MPTVVVLFNLRSDASIEAYENWARSTDLPTVSSLASVAKFQVLRTASVLGSAAAPPFQYVETIEVQDLPGLFNDIASPLMQKIAAEFQAFADAPIFMLCNSIEER